jgi:hypothetical protein
MTDTFDPTKPVRCRNGLKAGIYSINNGGLYPIHGWYENSSGGDRYVTSWTATGRNLVTSECGLDISNIPPEPKYADPPREIEMVQFPLDSLLGKLYALSFMRQKSADGEYRILRYVLAEGQV